MAVISTVTKETLGGKGLFHFTASNDLCGEVRAETHSRNLEARTEEQPEKNTVP